MQIFANTFAPDANKRFSFLAKGATAAVAIAQLIYNGASTLFYTSSEGYVRIEANYSTWDFHAPKDLKTTAGGSTALNAAYLSTLTLGDMLDALSAATKYSGSGANGVEIPGWEGAMRTLQFAEDKVNGQIAAYDTVQIKSAANDKEALATLSGWTGFEAPSGTVNLFSQLMDWLNAQLGTVGKKVDVSKLYHAGSGSVSLAVVFSNASGGQNALTFSFSDYAD